MKRNVTPWLCDVSLFRWCEIQCILYYVNSYLAPDGPPLDVKVTALGSQKLQVTWTVSTSTFICLCFICVVFVNRRTPKILKKVWFSLNKV